MSHCSRSLPITFCLASLMILPLLHSLPFSTFIQVSKHITMLCCPQPLQNQTVGLPQEYDSDSQNEADVFYLSSASAGSEHLPNLSAQDTAKEMRNKITEQNKVMISKKRRLRLTFSPPISTVVGTGTGALSREDYTAKERKNCWWDVEEISRSRAPAKRVMTLISHSGQHFVKMIDDSFKLAQELSTSLREKEMDALMRDPNNFCSDIDATEFNGHGRRGL